MSQTTRCPACQTHFKVVADQLRISDGWVRCGNCEQVFDATQSLEAAPPPPMFPDMNLEGLRSPVARVKQAAAPEAAWQWAGPPQASANSRALSLPSNGREAVPEQLGALEEAPPDFAETVPASFWPDVDLRGAMGNADDAATKDLEPPDTPRRAGLPHAHILPEYPRAASPEPAKTQENRSHREPRGYELPGALMEDDDEDWNLLVSAPAATQGPSPSAWRKTGGIQRENANELMATPDAAEPPEPDLAHFIAEFSALAANSRSEEAVPVAASLGPQERIEPRLEPQELAGGKDFLVTERGPLIEAEQLPDWQLVQAQDVLSSPSVPSPVDTDRGALQDPSDSFDALKDLFPAEPSFVRSARRRAFWSDVRVKAGLWVGGVMLCLLLAAQVTLHHRDMISATYPQARMHLVKACEFLRCTVRPHRDIGALLVDGSSFNRVQGDRYQFLLTLRNSSRTTVESPAVELTLTDVQDLPIVRRVLVADELGLPDTLQARQEWSGAIPVSMTPGTARVAGYRVLAFYPN